MVTGPATFVVMLIVGLLLLAGALILGTGRRRSNRQRPPAAAGSGRPCHHCGHNNVSHASYCARCGEPLGPHKT